MLLDSRQSATWNSIEGLLQRGVQSAVLIKVERILNKLQWQHYMRVVHRLRSKLQGQANERMLWHGPRGTPPDTIIAHEVSIRSS